MTNHAKQLHSVAIYLHGDGLDPETVSLKTGLTPTEVRVKGQLLSRHATTPIRAKSGLWSIVRDGDGNDVESTLSSLFKLLRPDVQSLDAEPGVERAYLDVFITNPHQTDVELRLGPSNLAVAARLGLALQVTVAATHERAEGDG